MGDDGKQVAELLKLVRGLSLRVEQLHDRVEQLNAIVYGVGGKMPKVLRLTAQEEHLMRILYGRRNPVAQFEIMDLLYGDDADRRDPKIVQVMICKVRKKIEGYGIIIENVWGKGYVITRDGRLILKSMMEEEQL